MSLRSKVADPREYYAGLAGFRYVFGYGARCKKRTRRLCEAIRGSADEGCDDLIHALEMSVLEESRVFQAEAEGAIESDVGEPD